MNKKPEMTTEQVCLFPGQISWQVKVLLTKSGILLFCRPIQVAFRTPGTLAITSLIMILLSLSGCDVQRQDVADISQNLQYNNQGVSFLYPKDWNIEEDGFDDGVKQISVVDPTGTTGFFITVLPGNRRMSLDKFVKFFPATDLLPSSIEFEGEEYLTTISESTYSTIERSLSSGIIKGVKEEFVTTVMGEQIGFVREYYSRQAEGKDAYCVVQGTTEDVARAEPAFIVFITSFVME